MRDDAAICRERYLNPILYSVYIFGFGIVAVCAA